MANQASGVYYSSQGAVYSFEDSYGCVQYRSLPVQPVTDGYGYLPVASAISEDSVFAGQVHTSMMDRTLVPADVQPCVTGNNQALMEPMSQPEFPQAEHGVYSNQLSLSAAVNPDSTVNPVVLCQQAAVAMSFLRDCAQNTLIPYVENYSGSDGYICVDLSLNTSIYRIGNDNPDQVANALEVIPAWQDYFLSILGSSICSENKESQTYSVNLTRMSSVLKSLMPGSTSF